MTLSALLCYCTARGDDGGDWEELWDLSALRRPPPRGFFWKEPRAPHCPPGRLPAGYRSILEPPPPVSKTHFFFGGFMMFCVAFKKVCIKVKCMPRVGLCLGIFTDGFQVSVSDAFSRFFCGVFFPSEHGLRIPRFPPEECCPVPSPPSGSHPPVHFSNLGPTPGGGASPSFATLGTSIAQYVGDVQPTPIAHLMPTKNPA